MTSSPLTSLFIVPTEVIFASAVPSYTLSETAVFEIVTSLDWISNSIVEEAALNVSVSEVVIRIVYFPTFFGAEAVYAVSSSSALLYSKVRVPSESVLKVGMPIEFPS